MYCFIQKGTVVHEIMHALGVFHEQSRPDRDNYVTINFSNIKPGKEDNFMKYSWGQSDTYNMPYDVASVMHYGSMVTSPAYERILYILYCIFSISSPQKSLSALQ